MEKSIKILVIIIFNFQFTIGQCQESLLPIYSNPMVFIDSLGHVVGTLPVGYKILNTKDGKHDGGFVQGLAGNSVSVNSLIPAKDFNTGTISFHDKTGKFISSYEDQFVSITPNINGFHIAKHVDKTSRYSKTTYNFLDSSGFRVFEDNGYYKADLFNEGFAAVNNRGWHYIDREGRKHDIIDSTINDITEVSSFYNGVSKIKIRKGRYKSGNYYRYIFIDKQGNKILDTEDIFKEGYIGSMGNMRDSISKVKFLDDKGFMSWGKVAYINIKGEVIGRFDSLFRVKEFTNGFVPIITQTRTKKNIKNVDYFILDRYGDRIEFDDNMKVQELLHIDDHFYLVKWKKKGNPDYFSGVFDALKKKFIFSNKHDIMGIKWNLISLRESDSKRLYVVNYKTGEIVYDTDKSNLVYTNIEEALDNKEEVIRYICSKNEDVTSLGELQNLKELTLSNIDVVELPNNFDFPNLKTLNIDGLNNLKILPDHIKSLRKLSLRNCTKSKNLIPMVTGQIGLEELFIINFDVTEEEKAKIKEMYPDAKVTIKGKAKFAKSLLQEEILGF